MARPTVAGGGEERRRALDRRTVWVLKAGTPAPVPVRLGISDGTQTEVLEGSLEEGDALVTEAVNPAEKKGPPGGPMMRRML
jgi:HlyD family secretion protein